MCDGCVRGEASTIRRSTAEIPISAGMQIFLSSIIFFCRASTTQAYSGKTTAVVCRFTEALLVECCQISEVNVEKGKGHKRPASLLWPFPFLNSIEKSVRD